MTGRYPREHGVRDNGQNALGTTHPTLASIFKEHGYHTAGFVASFVLDSRFGLDRGFDTYNDDMGQVNFDVQALEWQLPANIITDRALQWLQSAKGGPFYCWVHYYDPHLPYLPPEKFRRADVLPYDGEIAFMDTQLKRLSDWLAASGLVERTLVLVVGDHGEALGEHVEKGHSEHVYHINVHIPMLFAHPAVGQKGKRISAIVESVDVFPTVLELFGWQAPADLMSRSLASGLAGRDIPSVSAYSESLFLFNALGWAEQRSITKDRWKYISSVKPELFDRKSDPGETKNLIADEPRRAAGLLKELRNRYEAMTPGEAAVPEWDSAAQKALEKLGYIGGSAMTTEEFVSPGLPDPKDMKEVLLQFKAAKEYLEQHDKPEDIASIIPLVKHVVEQSPNSQAFHSMLGLCYMRARQPADALAPLEAAIRIEPRNTAALALRGDALAELKRFDEALSHYRAALALEGKNAVMHVGMANVLYSAGRLDEAVKHYETALELFPTHAPAHNRLGIALTAQGKVAEANAHYQEALRLRPENPAYHYNLGLGFLNAGRYSEATVLFQEAVRLRPDYGDALMNLGMAQSAQGALSAAKEAFTQAMSIPEFAAKARYHLGVLIAKEGHSQEFVKLFEQAIALQPTFAPPILDLSQFYLGQGNSADAVRILRIGVSNFPDNLRILERLARVLAMSRDDTVRDGATALTLAERASKLSGGREPVIEAALAAAYAESGDFPRAIEYGRKALQLAEDAKKSEIASVIQSQLEKYLNNQPFRDPRF
jgi:arylsulfatase A-like enzyme/Flp pilus assembly protein TadD